MPYNARVNPEIQELQGKLKEFLYDCVVELKATKAALFLFDRNANQFELVTDYGFKGTIRQAIDHRHPIVDRCGRGRSPFFVNGLTAEPRFAEVLFESQTERLLVAPIYLRGQLVGLIDMRDKAGKQPFDTGDLPKAQQVAEKIAELFASRNVFGQRFITLSGNEPTQGVLTGVYSPAAQPGVGASPPAGTQPGGGLAATPNLAATPPPQAASYVPRVSSLILEARAAAERVRASMTSESLTESELGIVREILRSVLLIPGATVAAFSAFEQMGGIQEIAARGTIHDDALALLQSKFESWLTKRNENAGPLRNRIHTPFGTAGPAITAADIQKVFTAPIVAGSIRGLYLTAGFANVPDRAMHELLAAFHQQLQMAIEQSMARRQAVGSRMRIADKIVEPDFTRYPELRRHCNAVVSRADAFARFLGLNPQESESVRVVALVHDAGMRLLEYERLYRKRDLSPDDLNILREHPTVGAALVEPLLGPEIALAVLCHHERYDGRGYPGELAGEEIPRLSRIVQICEAYEAMTSADSYQHPQTQESAIAAIAAAAGSQFDPNLAARFAEMMRTANP